MTGELTEALTRTLWFPFKRQLRTKLSAEEWNLFVRPMYLLKAIQANSNQVHLLATVPPNGRIISAACNRLPLMRQLLAPSFNISLTVYPDEYQISEARKRYGIDMRPKTRNRMPQDPPMQERMTQSITRNAIPNEHC
jgi:hypothetical protein